MTNKVKLTKIAIMDLFNSLSMIHRDSKIKLPFKFSYAANRTVKLLTDVGTAISEETKKILAEYNKEHDPILVQIQKDESEVIGSEASPNDKKIAIFKLGEKYKLENDKLEEKHKEELEKQKTFSLEEEEVEVFVYAVEDKELDLIPNEIRMAIMPMLTLKD